jgi:hypothetical protein
VSPEAEAARRKSPEAEAAKRKSPEAEAARRKSAEAVEGRSALEALQRKISELDPSAVGKLSEALQELAEEKANSEEARKRKLGDVKGKVVDEEVLNRKLEETRKRKLGEISIGSEDGLKKASGLDVLKPETEREAALLKLIQDLREEVAQLRHEVHQMRGGKGLIGKPAPEKGLPGKPVLRDGEVKKGPRDGEGPVKKGPPDGERAPQ